MDCTGSFPRWWSSFAGCISILYNIKDKTLPLPCSWGYPDQCASSVLQLLGHVFKWCAAMCCWKTSSSPKQSTTMLQPKPAAACNPDRRARDAHTLFQQTASLPPWPPLTPVPSLTPLSCEWELPWAGSLQFTSACSQHLKEDAMNFTRVFSHFLYEQENRFLINGDLPAWQHHGITWSLYQEIGELLHKAVWESTFQKK